MPATRSATLELIQHKCAEYPCQWIPGRSGGVMQYAPTLGTWIVFSAALPIGGTLRNFTSKRLTITTSYVKPVTTSVRRFIRFARHSFHAHERSFAATSSSSGSWY